MLLQRLQSLLSVVTPSICSRSASIHAMSQSISYLWFISAMTCSLPIIARSDSFSNRTVQSEPDHQWQRNVISTQQSNTRWKWRQKRQHVHMKVCLSLCVWLLHAKNTGTNHQVWQYNLAWRRKKELWWAWEMLTTISAVAEEPRVSGTLQCK